MNKTLLNKALSLLENDLFETYEMGSLIAIEIHHTIYYCVVEDNSIFAYAGDHGFESWVDLLDQDDNTSDLLALEKEYMRYGYSLDFVEKSELTPLERKQLEKDTIKDLFIIPLLKFHQELVMPQLLTGDDQEKVDDPKCEETPVDSYQLFSTIIDVFSYLLENNIPITSSEDSILFIQQDGKNYRCDELDIPDDFNRFPSPGLLDNTIEHFEDCTPLFKRNWDLHMFIIPNANIFAKELGVHKFPIAYVILDDKAKNVLSSGILKDFDTDYHEVLESFLTLIDEIGKPSTLNVTNDRAYYLMSKLCGQLDIDVSQFSTLDDSLELETQFIDNFEKETL